MKGQTRTAGLLAAALFIAGQAAAFDWPQTEIESASFYSYFGQLRGGTISSSLVFTESADIKAADGKALKAWKDAVKATAAVPAHMGRPGHHGPHGPHAKPCDFKPGDKPACEEPCADKAE